MTLLKRVLCALLSSRRVTSKAVVSCLCLLFHPISLQTSFSQDGKSAPPAIHKKSSLDLRTEKDQVSYLLGRNLGEYLKLTGHLIDNEILFTGISEVLSGIEPAQDRSVLEAALLRSSQVVAQKRLDSVNEFLKRNALLPDVTELPSKLQFKIIKNTTNQKPVLTDRVRCRLRIQVADLSGEPLIRTSVPRFEDLPIQTMSVAYNNIQGIVEGLQQMPAGSRFEFWIPAELCSEKFGKPLPPETLWFAEVELVEILPAVATPTRIRLPSAEIDRLIRDGIREGDFTAKDPELITVSKRGQETVYIQLSVIPRVSYDEASLENEREFFLRGIAYLLKSQLSRDPELQPKIIAVCDAAIATIPQSEVLPVRWSEGAFWTTLYEGFRTLLEKESCHFGGFVINDEFPRAWTPGGPTESPYSFGAPAAASQLLRSKAGVRLRYLPSFTARMYAQSSQKNDRDKWPWREVQFPDEKPMSQFFLIGARYHFWIQLGDLATELDKIFTPGEQEYQVPVPE